MDTMEQRRYEEGQVIFHQGEYQPFMFEILHGSVKICADYGRESEKTLVTLRAEDAHRCFGEMGLIDAYPRSATAIALEPTELLLITREQVSTYFAREPDAVLYIMEQLSSRIRALTADYMEACHVVADWQNGTPGGEMDRKLKKFAELYADVPEDALRASLLMNPYTNLKPKG